MRYLSLFRPASSLKAPSDPAQMTQMQRLAERETKAGRFLMTGALLPASQGKRVRRAAGKVSVVEDAALPAFAEGCGFAILQARDAADQQTQIEEFLAIAGDGECIILPLMDVPGPH